MVEEVPAGYVVVVTVPAGTIAAVIEYNVVVVAAVAVAADSIAITDYILGHSAYIHIAHCLALHVVIHVM